uniref:Putative c-myc binding protein n=1 Tax=Ornithodoros turicata TaxID=34597 RepID=A0A2R5L907_9ACAR
MSSYRNFSQPVDSKKEEFRKYLDSNGVLDALTQALKSLFEETERPADPLEYLKRHLAGDTPPMEETVSALKQELKTTREALNALQERCEQTKAGDA